MICRRSEVSTTRDSGWVSRCCPRSPTRYRRVVLTPQCCLLPSAYCLHPRRWRFCSGLIPTLLKLLLGPQIFHQRIIEVATLATGKNADLKIGALENLQTVVHAHICFPLIRGRKRCSFDKFRHELINV